MVSANNLASSASFVSSSFSWRIAGDGLSSDKIESIFKSWADCLAWRSESASSMLSIFFICSEGGKYSGTRAPRMGPVAFRSKAAVWSIVSSILNWA